MKSSPSFLSIVVPVLIAGAYFAAHLLWSGLRGDPRRHRRRRASDRDLARLSGAAATTDRRPFSPDRAQD